MFSALDFKGDALRNVPLENIYVVLLISTLFYYLESKLPIISCLLTKSCPIFKYSVSNFVL